MKNVLKTIEEHQQLVSEREVVSFTEAEFDRLCEAFKGGYDIAGRNGILIGAATAGVIAMGFKGYDMFKKFREKKYFAAVTNNVSGKEVAVFVKAKDIKEAEKKVDDIIKNELDNECTFLEIHEI